MFGPILRPCLEYQIRVMENTVSVTTDAMFRENSQILFAKENVILNANGQFMCFKIPIKDYSNE